ncbi:MAG: YaaL family protein [Clostridiales bacterium]|jgi:predicted Zn-ribbon and HTH transcriptional regulator|nr:YaaL family protein [Clostridiales bacterium]
MKKIKLKKDDAEILSTLEKIRAQLNELHKSFDQVTEPALIDSCIFEIQSLNMKYKYYYNQCKQRGLNEAFFRPGRKALSAGV